MRSALGSRATLTTRRIKQRICSVVTSLGVMQANVLVCGHGKIVQCISTLVAHVLASPVYTRCRSFLLIQVDAG